MADDFDRELDRVFDRLEEAQPVPVEYEEGPVRGKGKSWRVPKKAKIEGPSLKSRTEQNRIRHQAALWVRAKSGIGRRQFARWLKISPTTVERIERDPNYDARGRIWARYHTMALHLHLETEATIFKREALSAMGME